MPSAGALRAVAAGLGRGASALVPERLFKKRRPPPGARPGTLVVDENAPPTRLRLTLYDAGGPEEREVEGPAELRGLLGGGRKAWLSVVGLGSEGVLRGLAEVLGIHPLAIEDVVNVPQRPKIEGYPGQLLLIARKLRGEPPRAVAAEQVSVLLGPGFVVTFQERESDVLEPIRRRLQEGRGPMRTAGPDYLAYALLDAVVDGYYPILERIGDELDALEESLFDAQGPLLLQRLSRIKRDLLQVRRAVVPLRDALRACLAAPQPPLSEDTRVFLRDTLDHCAQSADLVEAFREMSNTLLNSHLSVLGHRTNEIMRVLTVMASIFIPLTFLAGIYGMNFENMPELRQSWAYPALLAVMAALAVVMLFHFRRKGWLGSSREADPEDGG